MNLQRAFVGVLVISAALLFATPALARTIRVHPGESIQAAIDIAEPGDRILVSPGHYEGNLTITTDRLTLQGAGPRRTFVEPSDPPNETVCVEDPGAPTYQGICVLGPEDDPVEGTRIDGFTVHWFDGTGVLLANAESSRVSHVEAAENEEYGISGFGLQGIDFIADNAHNNGAPGFYVGDSPESNARVIGNTAHGNGGVEGFGIFLRDSSHGVVIGNTVYDNCAGIVFADTGENPDPVMDWRGTGNYAAHNDLACPQEALGPQLLAGQGGEGPPISGLGILLLGTQDVQLRWNAVVNQDPEGDSFASGGIAVVDATPFGGAEPTGNSIERNFARGNDPVDIYWDEIGSDNSFEGNFCEASTPDWICS